MRKTKIICTIGPATNSVDMLAKLMKSGMDIARLNFSHGLYEEHRKTIEMIKEVREKLNMPVAIMLDTKGPEIRIKTFADKEVELVKGNYFTLTTDEIEGTKDRVSVTCSSLKDCVKTGTHIYADDGNIHFIVDAVRGNDIVCKIIDGGILSNRKSINVPNIKVNLPYISEKDKNDIIFGIENGVDFIAASFVRSAADVLDVKTILEQNHGQYIQIIAKIENNEGVENIDEILRISDGVMVARGDMGVEIPFEELPRIQKILIKKAYMCGKKAITATQMLESMINNPRPTRAETSDVANAIYDDTSAIMLSGETAVGKYPVAAVETMVKIAAETENHIDYKARFQDYHPSSSTVADALSHATVTTALDLKAAAIITVTKTGTTARMISKYRPDCPIISCTPDPHVQRQLAMSWGVVPVLIEEKSNTDELFDYAVEKAMETGVIKLGDLVAITSGVPLGIPGTTNILKVHLVGNILVSGTSSNIKTVSGKLCVCKNEKEALDVFEDGDILVIPETSNNIMGLLRKARGIITEEGGVSSHASVVGLSLDIPVIFGAEYATSILKSGTIVTIDGSKGFVYSGVMSAI